MKPQRDISELVKARFVELFGRQAESILVRSPGRINLIGEHTDYNDGFVLPSAIDQAIYLQVALRNDSTVRMHSVDFSENYTFDVNKPARASVRWANYLIGVVVQLAKMGYSPRGFDCVFAGDIPIGAGMSSSAAVEAGLAFALNALLGFSIDRPDLARIAQRSENEFVGVNCGIMDQFANLLSKGGSALHLDCRSLDFEYIPFETEDLKFVLCDTGVKHELASSEYNLRRRQCETGVSVIRRHIANVRCLRDVSHEMLETFKDEMDAIIYKRCRYVLEENARVDDACRFLRQNDYESFGRLLYKSHEGLRDQFEVSCSELDILVDAASTTDGILGSRMMGGGFGGCTLNLVRYDAVSAFGENIREAYSKSTGKDPKIYECGLAAGTAIVPAFAPAD
jgi:galactokinase